MLEPSPDWPWLDDRQQQAWLSLVGVMRLLPQVLENQLLEDSGLTLFEYGVLSRLSQAPERTLRMKELAESTNGSLSRLSHVVARLERRGFMSRSPLPEDGRITVARLTPAGHKHLEAAAPGHVAAVRELVIEPLTAQQQHDLQVCSDNILRAVAARQERLDKPATESKTCPGAT